MKFSHLSNETQDGFRRFAKTVHDDELLFDDISSSPEAWAWVVYQLRAAPDRPDWFPKGKWATIQVIEAGLLREAAELLTAAGVVTDAR